MDFLIEWKGPDVFNGAPAFMAVDAFTMAYDMQDLTWSLGMADTTGTTLWAALQELKTGEEPAGVPEGAHWQKAHDVLQWLLDMGFLM